MSRSAQEVMEHRWVDPGALTEVAARAPWLLSPWSATQIGLLDLRHLVAAHDEMLPR